MSNTVVAQKTSADENQVEMIIERLNAVRYPTPDIAQSQAVPLVGREPFVPQQSF